MPIIKIKKYGEDVLLQKSEKIEKITEDIKNLALSMVETMHIAPGLGLSAPQVGESVRLITVDLSVGKNKEDLFVLINPEIIEKEGEIISEEGCLSLPNIYEKIPRPSRVLVKGSDLGGIAKTIDAHDLMARVFCHEIDHLNGVLIIDYLSPLKKKLIRKKLIKQREKGLFL
jgi:peptide deformylase